MTGKYDRHKTIEKKDVLNVTSIGEGLKVLRTKDVEFDHKMAYWLLGEDEKSKVHEFPGDRRLKQDHVDALVRTMIRGTFRSEWVHVIVCHFDGKIYRMNGQHTAWARLEMPAKWPCWVEMIEYQAKSEHDMRQLYSSIDRGSPRTKSNVTNSYLVGTEQFATIKAAQLRVLPMGFSAWHWETAHERAKHDGDEVSVLLLSDHYDVAHKVGTFLNACSSKEHWYLFRAGVVGAMFATFAKAPQVAAEFWRPVADGVGIEKQGDARLKLRNQLMQTAVSLGGGASSAKRKMSLEEMYRMCLYAWRAYRDGRTVVNLRGSEKGERPGVK